MDSSRFETIYFEEETKDRKKNLGCIEIIRDRYTGVEYLCRESPKGGLAITPLLKPNGLPVNI